MWKYTKGGSTTAQWCGRRSGCASYLQGIHGRLGTAMHQRLANRTATVRDFLRLTRKYGGLTWINVRQHPNGVHQEPVRIVTLSLGCRVTERGEVSIPAADEFEQKYFLSRETIFARMTEPLHHTTVQVVHPPQTMTIL
jgi:hypothetical protein